MGRTPADHHKEWLRALADDSLGNTLIVAPPGHAKTTELMSYAAWYLGHNWKTASVGYISNTAQQAERMSMAIRDTITQNPRFRRVFPDLEPDKLRKWSAPEWFLQREDPLLKDASLTACGVGGPALGSRFSLVIFDDVCDQENMATEIQREKAIDWLKTTAMSRLYPDGRAICIMTRWHEQDFAAWCKNQKKEPWHVIEMPAINDNNEALWPEVWPLDSLLEKKDQLGSWRFDMMYQCQPKPRGGATIHDDWFGYYHSLPDLRIIADSWDTAFKPGEGSSHSVGITFGITQEQPERVAVLDITRRRMEFPDLKRAVEAQAYRSGADICLIEDAASGQSVVQELRRDTSVPVVPFRTQRSKQQRLEAYSHLFESRRILLPGPELCNQLGIHWVETYKNELTAAPYGEHWDQVDATTQFLEWWRQKLMGRPPEIKVTIHA